jgi:DNA repair ATPase RecN
MQCIHRPVRLRAAHDGCAPSPRLQGCLYISGSSTVAETHRSIQTLHRARVNSGQLMPASLAEDTAQANRNSASSATATVRSTSFINGAATPLRNARALGASLVDINSQNAAAALCSPSAQLALLDRLTRCSHLAASFASGLMRLQAVQERLEELSDFEDSSLRRNEQVCCAVRVRTKSKRFVRELHV